MLDEARSVHDFWLQDAGEAEWYAADPAFDTKIRDRFLPVWEAARAGRLEHWLRDATTLLAYVIVTDQFPRNMFRADPRAFATDARARHAACLGIHRSWDLRVPEPGRQFYYMPLMHSEVAADQDRCVRLMLTRMPEARESLLHARAHREVIRRFGRFPFRNAALGRRSTPEEEAWLAAGGYMAAVAALRAPA